jgi:predicted RNA-binding Zn-ribbon protein involved in translation (DUF1610 family)
MSDYFEHKINQAFDPVLIPFTCPKCSNEFQESIGRLKNRTSLACPACGYDAPLDPNPFGEIADVLREHIRKSGQGFV